MNFLAHCALAHDYAHHWRYSPNERNGLLAGAIYGDFIKGRVPATWPRALQQGARLHRKIDALSNRDAHIRTSCERFAPELRRIAPILVDIVADAHLTRHWHDYYDEPLSSFTRNVYASIDATADSMPAKAQRFVGYMIDSDLLAHYDEWHHIDNAVDSVIRRLPKRLALQAPQLYAAMREVMPQTEADFRAYYAKLQRDIRGIAPQDL